MPKTPLAPKSSPAQIILAGTVVGVVLVATLYWAQLVLIPVALAIFLTFLLIRPVKLLQKFGLGRIPSVIVVVLLAGCLLGGLGWVVTRQTVRLVEELPTYSQNIKMKVKAVRELSSGGPLDRLAAMFARVSSEVEAEEAQEEKTTVTVVEPGVVTPPQPLVVQEDTPWWTPLSGYLGSVLESVGGFALSLVLVVFMLLNWEDLRNRFIRLVGSRRLSYTTRAMDEAGARISKYLAMQAIVNGSYGLTLAIGLWLVGLDYAFLWGILAAIMRYVPYIGPWVAALFPISLSLAMSAGWGQPLLVVGLFVVLELVSNNVIEPWLYGQSIGVSEVALLVAAAFWAFLWGPVGMVLSAPLTVCLVVIGKYVPQLAFLDILLGDAPALDADISYYQRLLSRDQDDAEDLVFARLNSSAPEMIYDELLLPVLSYSRRDHLRGEISADDVSFIQQVTSEILEDLEDLQPELDPLRAEAADLEPGGEAVSRPVGLVLGIPAVNDSDRLALEMLGQSLDPRYWELTATDIDIQAGRIAIQVDRTPTAICLVSLPPGGLHHTRYLCKRLRSRFPDVPLLVGRWGQSSERGQTAEELQKVGVQSLSTTLLGTRDQLNALLPESDTEAAVEKGSG